MVKKNVDFTALTSCMHLIQLISTVGLGAFAATQVSDTILICIGGIDVRISMMDVNLTFCT